MGCCSHQECGGPGGGRYGQCRGFELERILQCVRVSEKTGGPVGRVAEGDGVTVGLEGGKIPGTSLSRCREGDWPESH